MAAIASRSSAPRLGTDIVGMIRIVVRDLFDPYRPELHYMRGPGPKWQAKHRMVPAMARAASRRRIRT